MSDLENKKSLYLIDGYGFVFRAYHSMPPLTNPAGTPVGAVYGFTNMLLKLRNTHKADYMAVVFDAGSKSFRNDIYPQYKANRPPAPEDLIPQFDLVRDAAKALNITSLEQKGLEADDIIATLTKQGQAQNLHVTVVSSDKDLMQLVQDGAVQMYDPMRDKYINEAAVADKFAVPPAKVLDVLSLMGDSSDNVPGIAGIGPKTAAELINTYGDLDNLLANAGDIKQNKRRQSLIEQADMARLSRELITLKTDAQLGVDLQTLQSKELDATKLGEFLAGHGFKSIAAKIGAKIEGKPVVNNEPAKPTEFTELKSIADLTNWLADLFECGGKLAIYPHANGLAIAKSGHQSAFIEYNNNANDLFDEGELSQAKITSALQPYLDDDSNLILLHNVKENGINPIAYDDIALMYYVANTGMGGYELPEITDKLLNLPLKTFKQEPTNKELADYAITLNQAHTALYQQLYQDKLMYIYHRLEKPLVKVIQTMEAEGTKIDPQFLLALSQDFATQMQGLEAQIYALANEEFNIASPKQLGEVLFTKLDLKPNGKKKKLSTNAEVLEDLAAQGHEIASKVLEWRGYQKLKTTYTDALPKQINPQTGRVHTSFGLTVTTTGRLSSTNPNLQNIPIRTEQGKKIRQAFIASQGNKLIAADYSQIELRLLAHVAGIQSLITALNDGGDIHAATAMDMFGQVTPETRRQAKTINFGIIYGISAFGLAQRLGIPQSQAKEYIDMYFAKYPGIKRYMDDTIQYAAEHGYVNTIMGRRCYIKNIESSNVPLRKFSERAAINAPLQGGAADIIKKAMLDIQAELTRQNMATKMILQVHDELIFDAPEAEAEQAAKLITNIMQTAYKLDVPLLVDANIGDNWAQVH